MTRNLAGAMFVGLYVQVNTGMNGHYKESQHKIYVYCNCFSFLTFIGSSSNTLNIITTFPEL